MRNRSHRLKRPIRRCAACLSLGLLTTIAVAWSCAIFHSPRGSGRLVEAGGPVDPNYGDRVDSVLGEF